MQVTFHAYQSAYGTDTWEAGEETAIPLIDLIRYDDVKELDVGIEEAR